MRAAGCVINDFADREFDPHVRRTASRPLARGVVSPAEALAVFAVLGLIALALLIPLNRPTQVLALVGGVLGRHLPVPETVLRAAAGIPGLAFSWSVPMAFAAQTGELPLVAWVLFVAGVLWTTAYDTIYALVDREDDLVIGIRSSAILFGARIEGSSRRCKPARWSCSPWRVTWRNSVTGTGWVSPLPWPPRCTSNT